MRTILLLIALSLFLGAASACSTASSNANADSPNAKRYPFKGKVLSVDRAAKTASIEHEAIEGYMPAMTMTFPIHSDFVWNDLKPGAEINAELVVDNTAKDPFFLDNLVILAAPDPNAPAPTPNANFAQIGNPVPDFVLTDQDGKKLSLASLKGKAVAITFIYTGCPLPDYCIKMSTNFSDLAKTISEDAALRDRIRLVSISFDPERDTPARLRSYGIGYLGNDPNAKFDVWKLAVADPAIIKKMADFFGLQYSVDKDDKTQIDHTLRTAVISPEGKLVKILPGNQWTKDELLEDLRSALDDKKQGE